MADRTCSVEGCDAPVRARGWCPTHYKQAQVAGLFTPRPSTSGQTMAERFFTYVTPGSVGECWPWQGHMQRGGYGDFRMKRDGHATYWQAHRASYLIHVGVIPEGLVIDHLCRNRACVNPAHLEPVTQGENVRRGLVGRTRLVDGTGRTICKNGHTLTAENTRRAPKAPHYVLCTDCSRARAARFKQRRANN